jgi:hypothetical protein
MPSASTQAKSMHYEPWATNVYHRETPPRERRGRGRNSNPRYFTSPLARAWSFAITAQSCSASP